MKMMANKSVFLYARFLLTLLLAMISGVKETWAFESVIRIGGSTTLLPVIADASVRFMEKYKTWDRVDPSFPKEPVVIYVTGGGSGFGVKSVVDSTNHIGMSSRNITEKEKTQLGKYREYLISKDCIAFAVNKKNPLAKKDNLTKEEVARIFSGEAKTFYDIDRSLPKRPIIVQMRDVAGGSTKIMQHEVLKDKKFTPSAVQVQSQGANLKKLETNNNTISYISSVIAMNNPKLKVFKYEGVLPTNENVINGKYKLTRPLILLVKDPTDASVMAFIDYMLGDGQLVIEEHGYIPINAVKKSKQK